jgi:hypothetical protein
MKTEDILSKIAHYEMARGIDKDVPGMSGFLPHYLRNQSRSDAAMMLRYEKIRTTAFGDLATMMEKSSDTEAPDSPSDGGQR